jgi:GTP diphosphokinase / guanosine-3',5'-bis(diphosphate) 3'-diphosphatase
VDGLMVRYAQCCQPVPGDSVVGYVTRGRGISIHRADCPNLLTVPDASDRRVEIDWQHQQGELFMVCLGVVGEDRRGLYADLMTAVSGTGTNIRRVDLDTKEGGMLGTVLVEVENQAHLTRVMRAMRRVKGVTSVDRREPAARNAES